MSTQPHRPVSGDPDRDLAQLLAGTDEPAFAIDTGSAAIVAANSAGLGQLGLAPTAKLPVTLDAASPAVARLRQIASGLETKFAKPETLMFWIGGRLARLTCQTRVIREPSRVLVLISPVDYPVEHANGGAGGNRPETNLDLNGHKAMDGIAHSQSAPGEALPPPRPRNDAETLKAIARVIRERRLYKSPPEPAHQDAVKSELTAVPTGADIAVSAGPNLIPRTGVQQGKPLDSADLARLAHELKTPLSAIMAAAEIMRDERIGPMGNAKYLGYAGDIHESAQHALTIVNRTLAGAGVKTGEILGPAGVEPVDLNSVVHFAVSPLQTLARSRNLSLTLELEDHLPMVLADSTAIRQIVLNLVTNALKFTPAQGDVHVVTGYLGDGGIFLVVRDTGEGMGADELDTILQNGADAYPVARPGGGYGLGLGVVRALAAANNADVAIDSSPSKGTTVLIGFPKDRIARG